MAEHQGLPCHLDHPDRAARRALPRGRERASGGVLDQRRAEDPADQREDRDRQQDAEQRLDDHLAQRQDADRRLDPERQLQRRVDQRRNAVSAPVSSGGTSELTMS